MFCKGIEPIYIRKRDLRSRDINAFMICEAVARIVGGSNVEGAQLLSNTWQVYVKDKASRIKLVSKRQLLVVNNNVQIFDKDPTLITTKRREEMDKLTIKMVPLQIENDKVKEMLESNGVQLLTDIKYTCEKDPHGNITTWKNGDRFVFVKPFDPPIQRSQMIDNHPVVVVHHGKDNKPCLACNQIGHR